MHINLKKSLHKSLLLSFAGEPMHQACGLNMNQILAESRKHALWMRIWTSTVNRGNLCCGPFGYMELPQTGVVGL